MNDLNVSINQSIIWGDMDAFNHINNTVYFRYFENIRMEYFNQSGINQYMQETNIGPILGETSCRYLLPLTYPDTIKISTQVLVLREKRFTMNYLVESEKLGKVVAEGNGEIIYFDYSNNKTALVPEKIRQNILKIEADAVEVIK